MTALTLAGTLFLAAGATAMGAYIPSNGTPKTSEAVMSGIPEITLPDIPEIGKLGLPQGGPGESDDWGEDDWEEDDWREDDWGSDLTGLGDDEDIGTGKSSYTYTQGGYYLAPYIFEIGWDLSGNLSASYPVKAYVELTDSSDAENADVKKNGRLVKVSFGKGCEEYASDSELLSVLSRLLSSLGEKMPGGDGVVGKPIIVSAEYVGDTSPDTLAEEYYNEESLTYFSAVFSALDTEQQLNYGYRMVDDSRVAYLASVIEYMGAELVGEMAEKAYSKNMISHFAVISSYLSEEQRTEWIARAEQDGRRNFCYILQEE